MLPKNPVGRGFVIGLLILFSPIIISLTIVGFLTSFVWSGVFASISVITEFRGPNEDYVYEESDLKDEVFKPSEELEENIKNSNMNDVEIPGENANIKSLQEFFYCVVMMENTDEENHPLDNFITNTSLDQLANIEWNKINFIDRNTTRHEGPFSNDYYGPISLTEVKYTFKDSMLTRAKINGKGTEIFTKLLSSYILLKANGQDNPSLKKDLQKYIFLLRKTSPDTLENLINTAKENAHNINQNREDKVSGDIDKAAKIVKVELCDISLFSDNFLQQNK